MSKNSRLNSFSGRSIEKPTGEPRQSQDGQDSPAPGCEGDMVNNEFQCIDAHTCGNPVRLVTRGGPQLDGLNMSEKREHFVRDFDWIRKGLMFEPRGHDMMSGAILYPPLDPANDAALLFIETSGCLPMCGHGTIGSVTIAIEEGLVNPKMPGKLQLETPAGIIFVEYLQHARPNILRPKVASVRFSNVASFVMAENIKVTCPGLGELAIDICYGGNFYAIVDIQPNYGGLDHYAADQLIGWGRVMRHAINEKYSFIHPENPTIKGCSHILWSGAILDQNSTARNVVFYGDKALDRSPCGTGTSARLAQWFAKGKIGIKETFIHESIIGSKFTGMVNSTTMVGAIPAIIPSIEGWAKIYGHNAITIDAQDDPYAFGFQIL